MKLQLLTCLMIASTTFTIATNNGFAEDVTPSSPETLEKEEQSDKPAKAKTIFGDSAIESSGGYGGPFFAMGTVAGKTTTFSGGRGGWIINRSFIIGGAGFGMSSDISVGTDSDKRMLHVGYGGFMIEYTLSPLEAIHAHLSMIIGAGGLSLKSSSSRDSGDIFLRDSDAETGRFNFVQPEGYVEANITNWMRVGLGLGYRMGFGVDLDGLTDSDISGVSGSLLLRFGSF